MMPQPQPLGSGERAREQGPSGASQQQDASRPSTISGRRRPVTSVPTVAAREAGSWAAVDSAPRPKEVSQQRRSTRAQTAAAGRARAVSQATPGSSAPDAGRFQGQGPASTTTGVGSTSGEDLPPKLPSAARGTDGPPADHDECDAPTTKKEQARSARIGSTDHGASGRASVQAGVLGRNSAKGRAVQRTRRAGREQTAASFSVPVECAGGGKATAGSLRGQGGKSKDEATLGESESAASRGANKKGRTRKRDNPAGGSDSSCSSQESSETSEEEEQEESEEEEEEEALGAKSEGRKRAPSLKTEQQLEERYQTQGRAKRRGFCFESDIAVQQRNFSRAKSAEASDLEKAKLMAEYEALHFRVSPRKIHPMQRPTSAPPLQQPHGLDGQPSIAELLDQWDDAQLRAYIANLKPPVKSYYEKFRKRRIAQLRSAVFSGMEAEKERLNARGVFQPHVNALRVRVKAKNAWHYALRQCRTSIQRNSLKEALRLPAVRNNKPEDFAEASLPTRLYDLVTRPEPLTDESVLIEIFPVYKMMADWVRRSSLYI